jgi:hypothetical protein
LGFLLPRALETTHDDLDGGCHEAQQADSPTALHLEMLGYLPSDDYANEDGDRQDQFIHWGFQQRMTKG